MKRLGIMWGVAATMLAAAAGPKAHAQNTNELSAAVIREAINSEIGIGSPYMLLKAGGNYCRGLKAVFPTNSPSEDGWLRKEVASGGGRAAKAHSSPEFGRAVAAKFFATCLEAAESANLKKSRALTLMAQSFAKFSLDAESSAISNNVPVSEWGLDMLKIAVPGILASALTVE